MKLEFQCPWCGCEAVLRGPDRHYPASLLPADRTTILTDRAGAP